MSSDCGNVSLPRTSRRRHTISAAPDPDRTGAMTGFDQLLMAAPDLARRIDQAADVATRSCCRPGLAVTRTDEAADQVAAAARSHEPDPTRP